jgi:hypothetical protein
MGKNILTKELLLKSVQEWNAAREENPDLKPDLRGVDLSKAHLLRVNLCNADLSGADLSKADLTEVNLRSANLTEADLYRADLSDSFLTGANLIKAKLSGARLIGSDLSGADLSESILIDANLIVANLSGANLNKADLSGTDLSGANLLGVDLSGAVAEYTMFADVDLSSAIGLETIRHEGPSTIGIDTIYKSNGNIPEVFLRGCGVPENFIEYVRTLTPMTKDYSSCFISYSSKDDDIAKRIHNDLQASGVRCWFAPHDLPIGAKTRPAIDDAIRIHDKLLLILSEHSVQSNWVEHEVEHALDLETERGKLVLFPVRLDDAVMDSKTGWASNVKRQRNIGDFTRWKDHDSYQKAFSRLLRDLKQ